MVFSCDRIKIWLMTTPVMAPKGLNDCAKLSLRVAVSSGPMAQTYELAEVSSTESPANNTTMARRNIMKPSPTLLSDIIMAG